MTLNTALNEQADYLKGSFFWHRDGTNLEVPILASLLSGRVLSETGGDTQISNTYAAYECLSDEDKELCATLRVRHSLANSLEGIYPEPTDEQADMCRKEGPIEESPAGVEPRFGPQITGAWVPSGVYRRDGL